jgi:hypothetical protein
MDRPVLQKRQHKQNCLKGLSHEIDFKNFDKNLKKPGLTKGRSWFFIFLGAPMIL